MSGVGDRRCLARAGELGPRNGRALLSRAGRSEATSGDRRPDDQAGAKSKQAVSAGPVRSKDAVARSCCPDARSSPQFRIPSPSTRADMVFRSLAGPRDCLERMQVASVAPSRTTPGLQASPHRPIAQLQVGNPGQQRAESAGGPIGSAQSPARAKRDDRMRQTADGPFRRHG